MATGGALTKDGAWVSPQRGFLFPTKAWSAVFRGKFVAALRQERDCRLAGDTALDAAGWPVLLTALYRHDWMVYAKQPMGGPAQVLDYLARYTHKVAISNHRLLGLEQGKVSLRVRDPQRPKSGPVASLPATEFIDRCLAHVLPPGFKRSRHLWLAGELSQGADGPSAPCVVYRSRRPAVHQNVRLSVAHWGGSNKAKPAKATP